MFPELNTKRFLLSRVTPDDQQFLFEGLSDPVTMPYNGVYYATFEATAEQIAWYDKNLKDGTGVPWKITSKSTGEKLGVISFYHYKKEHKKAEIGFWLLPAYWNKGITSEVLQAVINYCRDELGMHRLEAFVEKENTASSRVLEKAGFVREGMMEDCEIKFGRYISLVIYGLIL